MSNYIGGQPRVVMHPLTTARPPDEVFADVEDEADENTRAEDLAAFVTTLQNAQIRQSDWTPAALSAEIDSLEGEQDVKSRARTILEDVSS